jgi:prepilin-type N-terminal cleavage/methylation domain-containing protein
MEREWRQTGWTLLELLVVLGIMGILTSLALPSLQGMLAHYRLEGAVQGLVSDLRLARQTAIAERVPILMKLDPDLDRYTLEREGSPDQPIIPVRDYRDPNQGYYGIDLVHSTKGDRLVFSPRGTTNSWTTILLRSAMGEEQQITLIATGRVKRSKP